MSSDYEILTEKDMPYFRDLVDKGMAVIIDIPENILMSLDIGEFEEDKEAAKISDEELLDYINKHKDSFIAAADRNEEIMKNTKLLEEELMGTEALPEIEEDEEENIIPVAPLPPSISQENRNIEATRAERETVPPMRDEEWKNAGGPTPSEMLDTYEREEEEQRFIRERRQRLREEQERRRRIEADDDGRVSVRPERRLERHALRERRMEKEDVEERETEDKGQAAGGSQKMPPSPAQLQEAKRKARMLGYTGAVPMEILLMLLDVTDEEQPAVPEEETTSTTKETNPEPPAEQDPPQNTRITIPARQDEMEEEGEEEEDEDEIEKAKDAAFLQGIEESIRKNDENMRVMRTEEKEEEVVSAASDNPYTGEDAELYQEMVESGQFSMEDIHFVMSNQIPTDYKRQLFTRMLEDKLDDDE